MRNSRLLVLSAAAVVALAATALASAARAPVEDGTLSIRDGHGTITLRLRGSMIGRFARGKMWVTESANGSSVVRGEERQRPLRGRTTLYSGTNLRFRIADDRRVVVRIQAAKVNLSVVGRGDVVLDGWGDPDEDVYFDGTYSLNGDDYRSLPDERTVLDLEAPAVPR